MSDFIKLGIFGARRGGSYAKAAQLTGLAKVTAVCDMNEETHSNVQQHCSEPLQRFTDFDAFIKSGIDAVVLTNYFHMHAEFAVRALRQGVHVFSETTAAVTLQKCVQLCKAAEESGSLYMLAENYPYFRACKEMRRIVRGGTLGDVLYAEGEYVHPMSREDYRGYTPNAQHWRAQMPSCYYLTHSIAPLMFMTDTMPKTVNARSVFAKSKTVEYEDEPLKDSATIMLCGMDNDALFRITGWAKFAPHGTYYRLCGEKGGAEMPRGEEDQVLLRYNAYDLPAGQKESSRFIAEVGEDFKKAKQCGHSGGDYYVTKEFLQCIRENKPPFFDVYRACAMAAVGIYAWRSSLENGREYRIPDFRNEQERSAVQDDNLSPFPDENGKANYPCTIFAHL